MPQFDPDRHHRRSVRLAAYDYAWPGWYFVTICAEDRATRFGTIREGELNLSDAGRMVAAAWEELPVRFPNVRLDAYVVMPNHLHGIVLIQTEQERANTGARANTRFAPTDAAPKGTTDGSLGRIIQAFKSLTTRDYIQGVRERDWPPFDGHLWQRSFYEHIIRDGDGNLDRIRAYIAANPAKWAEDRENPDRTGG